MNIFYLISILFVLFLSGCNKITNENLYDATKQSYDANSVSENYRDALHNEIKNEDIDTPTLLSEYSTNILTNDDNRYNNIKIVSDRLNNYVLKSGEVFSYNKVCGPYGKSDGFLKANILLSDGSHKKGFGGGVCQLSSTLYNAVKDLDIRILERHNHSVPVAYVPKNQDATVSLQSNLDFKFKNNYDASLRFKTICTEDKLTVEVYKENTP